MTDEFFHTIFGTEPNGFIEIRAIGEEGIKRGWYKSVDDLVSDLQSKWGPLNGEKQKFNLYFGICPRIRKRGKQEDIQEVRVLWCDVDTKNYLVDGKPNFYKMSNTVLNYSPAPDIVVNTGGGYHCYWRLKEPARDNFSMVRNTMRSLAKELRGDHTQDLSRVFRVPMTLNWKYDPPHEVEIVYVK
ncbi:MAG: hypothetical protein JSV56_04570 [Methanomassiliicoccales archaeon]|nr:MAG: hypothetical protein JSV56_04570 [Methanomassiliicoccales archaeon]